VQWGP